MTTKSGTPQFHGNLYDFVSNEAFNSRNYFDIVYTSPPPPGQLTGGQTFGTKRHYIGGRISGEPLGVRFTFHIFSTAKKTRHFSSFPKNSAWRKLQRNTTRRYRD